MTRFICYMVVVLCMHSCKKEDPKSPYIGEATATRDNKPWASYIYTTGHEPAKKQIDMVLAVADEDDHNIIREKILLQNLSLNKGVQYLDTMGSAFSQTHFGAYYVTLVDDGDVIGDVLYSPSKNEHNYVIVDSYDSLTCELKGRFNMYLVFGWGRPKFDQSLPDTLWFRDGTFNVRIKK